jgi:hypothetical protein
MLPSGISTADSIQPGRILRPFFLLTLKLRKMIYLNQQQTIELNCAELSAKCGPIGYLPASDSWHVGITEWVDWCGRVEQYNPHYGWGYGCHAGKRIGSKVKTLWGTRQLLASRVNWLDNL